MSTTSPLLEPVIRQRSIALLQELCAISSPSGDRAGVEAMARRIAAIVGEFGLQATIVEEDDSDGERQPVLVARPGVHRHRIPVQGLAG